MFKIKNKQILIASSMKDIPKSFWDWFFSETSFGMTNIINVHVDKDDYALKHLKYMKIIIDKYKEFSYNEYGIEYIEVENDLS